MYAQCSLTKCVYTFLVEGQRKNFIRKVEAIETENYKQINELTRKIEEAQSAAESNRLLLASANERHAAEMELVDAKIRKALSAKDQIIVELEHKLRLSHKKTREAEELIESLNAGLMCVDP
jgi:hypothetical protein